MAIKDYSTTASSNTSLFPEGMSPAAVNNGARQVQADIRSFYETPQWRDLGHTVTYATTTTFTIAGDVTANYIAGQRIKCTDSSPPYGSIASSSYSAPNTTVTVTLDSGNLSASLTAVALGIDPTNDPIPYAAIKGGPDLSGTNAWSGTNNFSGTVNFSGKVSFLDDGELTISSGAITITGMNHTIDTEGDASTDDLVTINGGADGVIITLRTENDSRDVVLKHGSGNIKTPDGVDITLSDDQNTVTLLYDAALSAWLVQSVFRGATSTATDTAAGIVEKATQSEVEAETTDKFPDAALLKYHPGIAKFWVFCTVSGGTPTATASYNVSSITDDGVGLYQVNFTTAFSSANYAVVGMAMDTTGSSNFGAVVLKQDDARTASNCPVQTLVDVSAVSDIPQWCLSGYGDQ